MTVEVSPGAIIYKKGAMLIMQRLPYGDVCLQRGRAELMVIGVIMNCAQDYLVAMPRHGLDCARDSYTCWSSQYDSCPLFKL